LILSVNGTEIAVESPGETPLLWVLRDELGLTGTKYGCGAGLCGACTVHVNGTAVRSCQIPLDSVKGPVTTIEGLQNDTLRKAWIEEQVSQCGYCQPGMLMSASALLSEQPHPSESEILNALRKNLCRCGTYPRVLKAVNRAVEGT
jgi:isoquinoline 1-oxidoreductase alpha subunit